ncbi:hypothetical protein B0H66DRAFT_644075 [Apodospora peruviana]|uniref:Uncharacterized protein n=1 Tax=Apodospora peruviana TaxID=516989 RepID=A0AAE0HU44_9PEZI|nr:hypothetical protein B0H66DRAFT_644075 [Apodospora peruviana]
MGNDQSRPRARRLLDQGNSDTSSLQSYSSRNLSGSLPSPTYGNSSPPQSLLSGRANGKTVGEGRGLLTSAYGGSGGECIAVGGTLDGDLAAYTSGSHGQAFASRHAAGARMGRSGALMSFSRRNRRVGGVPALRGSLTGGELESHINALSSAGLIDQSGPFVAVQGTNASASISARLGLANISVQSMTGHGLVTRNGKDIKVESSGSGSAGITGNIAWARDGDDLAVARLTNSASNSDGCGGCHLHHAYGSRKRHKPCGCKCHR